MTSTHRRPLTTTSTPAPNSPSDYGECLAKWQEENRDYERRAAEVLPDNEAAFFDALAKAGVASVTVVFDGYGDSGQIEDIQAKSLTFEPTELPTDTITIATPIRGQSEIIRSTLTIRQALETMSYDFLAQTHQGWENEDGAYGDFTFDVQARSIFLAYNERITDSMYSGHHF